MDEGPSAREFLDDDYDEDNERLGDDEPLAVTADRLRKAVSSADDEPEQPNVLVFEADSEDPPPPPPKLLMMVVLERLEVSRAHRRVVSLIVGMLAFSGSVLAIGQETCVSFKASHSNFPIVSNRKATPILLSPDEWGGVQRTAFDFASDIEQVTGIKPTLKNVTSPRNSFSSFGSQVVIVGTLGKSSLIDEIVNRTKLDVSSIEGKWEAYMTKEIQNPLPGIHSAYAIIGSDKRGTIYALYDHSEQFGVSPWWADVPTTKHSELFVESSGCAHGTPTVKYRAILLNDEQPALQNWAFEKFTNGKGAPLTNSPFNHFFYSKVFELMLRLKANYLWPAIWASAFAIDDTMNQPLANWYGIVMGTTHEEPMMRSTPVEWDLFGQGPWDYQANAQNIYNYWVEGVKRSKDYENIFTVGMRGAVPLPAGEGIPLLEKAVSDQRGILMNIFNISDVTTIPQVWTLYKEVQGYYEEGLQVPDDVTLLWSDDNWGNIRRYPTVSERNRTGGAGIYYHVDYVGQPRDYKWITTFEQMSTAVARDATRIWVLNVGDLKPYEMHTEFFLTYAWDAARWTHMNIGSFVNSWAQREFDLDASDAAEVAAIMHNLTRHNSRRKPELLNATLYSLTNYREYLGHGRAENVLAELQGISEASTRIYNKLPEKTKPAFFQMLQHPVQATLTLTKMWIAGGTNNLRATQGRNSANDYASQVEQLFEQDYELELAYHGMLDGLASSSALDNDSHSHLSSRMPFVTKVNTKKQARHGPMRIIPEGTAGAWPGDNQFNCAAGYGCPDPVLTMDPFLPEGNRFVDVALGGPNGFTFTATSNVTWLKITPAKGSVSSGNPEQRVFLNVDWEKVTGVEAALIVFNSSAATQPQEWRSKLPSTYPSPTEAVTVTVIANHTVAPVGFKGFVEGDGTVSIEAAHATRNTTVQGITWIEIPGLGRTHSGVTPWPRGGNELNFTAGAGPSIEYDFYLFNTIAQGGNVTITTLVSPSLNGLGDDRPLGLALQIDDEQPKTSYFVPPATPGDLPDGWDGTDGWVANNIIQVPMVFQVQPGAHTLKVWMIEPAVVVQKIIIDTGGVKPSFLGPPESIRV
ncbi:Glycoside Hydrolase Family 115 protein [Trametes cinnabarina]|uniref:Glycoside Hydrolase Family 115 protein n=1 Tax=Pycnoporus cinnabarinus TaxID=5643 RepID=A0A060S8N7_PYCCI|nr:Glycoside Hydrolase Family 115 protein [Trametes cinnabarina]